jgi:hypothetical protein
MEFKATINSDQPIKEGGLAYLVEAAQIEEFSIAMSGVGPMTSASEFVSNSLDMGVDIGKLIHEQRKEYAISGAMRWPWSQEARIKFSLQLRPA